MAARSQITPNRRGNRSRETVLDAAERLMAEHGYEAATIAALVDEAGLPASSIYHYFGSKEGVLLAVMERGADRFFAGLPDFGSRDGTPVEYLGGAIRGVAPALARNPDFLRILVVMTAQPADGESGEVHSVVNRVRDVALDRLRGMMGVAFDEDPAGPVADHLSRFALATFDGAFIAQQSSPDLDLGELLVHLPTALVAVHGELVSEAA